MNDKPMNADEAAAALGVHRESVMRWIRSGSLATLGGRPIMIDPAAVAALVRTCQKCGARFVPRRPIAGSVFCSDACRWAAGNEKRKTGRPMGRPPAEREAPDPAAVPERLRAAVNMIRNPKG